MPQKQHKPAKPRVKREEVAAEASWKRTPGAFSAKAKKEYLRWRREQKRAVGQDEGDSQEESGGGLRDVRDEVSAATCLKQQDSTRPLDASRPGVTRPPGQRLVDTTVQNTALEQGGCPGTEQPPALQRHRGRRQRPDLPSSSSAPLQYADVVELPDPEGESLRQA